MTLGSYVTKLLAVIELHTIGVPASKSAVLWTPASQITPLLIVAFTPSRVGEFDNNGGGLLARVARGQPGHVLDVCAVSWAYAFSAFNRMIPPAMPLMSIDQ